MSFVRIKPVGSKHAPPRKKASAKKKAWDDTQSDLNAYKATPDEIAYRKAAHRSKNAVSSHLHRPVTSRKGKRGSPFRNIAQARKYAIMKEVLYDQEQLQDVLEKSDTMMAVVKDLFGDNPRRFEGYPTVTTAPDYSDENLASFLTLHPDIHTRTEELSDTVMNASALNEFLDSASDADESGPIPLNYQPKINMQRFQKFIELEEKNHTMSTISGQAGMSHLGQTYASLLNMGAAQSSQLPDQTHHASKDGSFRTPPKKKVNADESIEMLCPPKSAINGSSKINRAKPRVPNQDPHVTSSNLTLSELRKVLETLEDEIASYEQLTGRRPPAERHRQETFSGYTLAIVDSVTKLTRYLRECDLQLRTEIMIREQLTQDVAQYKLLVDALTSDIMLTQEDYGKMTEQFYKFKMEMREEIYKLKRGKSRPHATVSPQTSPASAGSNTAGLLSDMDTPPKAEGQLPSVMPIPENPAVENSLQEKDDMLPSELNHFGDHLKPVSSAVLLSPPVRRSRVAEADRNAALLNGQQNATSLPGYVSSMDGNSSAMTESFADLPDSAAPTVINQNLLQQAIDTQHRNHPVPNSHPATTIQSNGYHFTESDSNSHAVPAMNAVVNSVNIPKPTALVQSNVGIGPSQMATQNAFDPRQTALQQRQQVSQSFIQNNQPISIVPQDKPQSFQRSHDQGNAVSQSQGAAMSHDGQAILDNQSQGPVVSRVDQGSLVSSVRSHDSGSDRECLASQIAALNKQHAEAQMRLQTLVSQQQNVDQRAADVQLQAQREQAQVQQQQQRQQVVDNQQRIQTQQLQYEQQQKLIEMVMQQQQKIQQQQQLRQQQNQSQPAVNQPQSSVNQQKQSQQHGHQQSAHQQQVPIGLQSMAARLSDRPAIPGQAMNGSADVLRQSTDIPGYRQIPKQTGLPEYPVSPNISPISQRSESCTTTINMQNPVPHAIASIGRGITVSLPMVDMDQSTESPAARPNQRTAS